MFAPSSRWQQQLIRVVIVRIMPLNMLMSLLLWLLMHYLLLVQLLIEMVIVKMRTAAVNSGTRCSGWVSSLTRAVSIGHSHANIM